MRRSGKRKQAEDVADLQTYDQHTEFKKRTQYGVLDININGYDESRGEDERNEDKNLEKPPENRA